ncbi:MAG: CRISP-associated protein Cas1 [Eubacteriales bacterium]|nr:CRISP-associated protein Cas1 [Eubacteriales bacterium]
MTVLHLTEPGNYAIKEGRRLVVKKEGEKVADIPVEYLEQVVVYGSNQITAPALTMLLDENIPVFFLSFGGRFRAKLMPYTSRHVDLRLKQYGIYLNEPERRGEIAAFLVGGKLLNCYRILKYLNKSRCSESLQEKGQKILRLAGVTKKERRLPKLRGIEGAGSRVYFQALQEVVAAEWGFDGRNRRPPRDPINALLSYGYALLLGEVMTAVERAGFDPYLGFLHEVKYGRPALALDLMEEFRGEVDLLVLRFVNLRMATPADFVNEEGEISLSPGLRKKFVRHFAEKMEEERRYDFLAKELPLREIVALQARRLAGYLQGEITCYRPHRVVGG